MPPAPKPTKRDRKKDVLDKKSALKDYRSTQAAIAIYRDDNTCVFCYFLHRKRTPRADIHHVYGRGDVAGDWRESYENLLCVCRKCHPLPIQTPGANSDLAYVEEIRSIANARPISKRFDRSMYLIYQAH